MQTKNYQEKLELMIYEYEQGKSLTSISKQYKADRGILAEHLRQRGYEIVNNQNRSRVKSNIFSSINSAERAYWLGFLYADGNVSSSDNRIELTLQERDINHLIKFQKFIRYDEKSFPQIGYRGKQRAYRIQFKSKQIKEDLIKLGCAPQKSLILDFPNKNQLSDEYLFDFCRGYIDGDGYLGIKTTDIPQLSILGTENFINGFIFRSGFKKLAIRKINNIYTIEWSASYVKNYLRILYSNSEIYLDRKYKIALPFIEETQ